jgi:hypothetical protein
MTKARQVADFGAGGFAAGKNKIINGDFGIWQRGTTGLGTGGGFNADRWMFYGDGTGTTHAISQQTFTPGTAPVSGYEGQYYFQYQCTVAGTGATERSLYTRIEDVRTLAGQTATLSFWAKADAARSISGYIRQNFGSGGSANVDITLASQSVTTSWARYSVTVTIPSISGKTIGTSSFLQLVLQFPTNVTETIQVWGIQLEAGSVATPFTTATGTVEGELAACQRYYWRASFESSQYVGVAMGSATSTTNIAFVIQNPVPMRVKPSAIEYTAVEGYDGVSVLTGTAFGFNSAGKTASRIDMTVTGATQFRPYSIWLGNNSTSYFGLTAEL